MEGNRKYSISFSGEFEDKILEHEFLKSDLKYHSRTVGTFALIFGAMFMLYAFSDFYSFKNSPLLPYLLSVRVFFLIMSFVMFIETKKISGYSTLVWLTIAYEVFFFLCFLVIIYIYGPIGLTPFFSMMAITLAVYLTPNRLIHAQITSVIFNLLFFLFYANFIEGIEARQLVKLIQYTSVFFAFGNIQAYITNIYKRKRFANSRELLRLSITDSLTGVYNRAKFDQELGHWVDTCIRDGGSLSLVLFDIDFFKNVNDNYGHLTGDSVLLNVTSIIKNVIRSTDVFARWGGDEFVILLPYTDSIQATEITERIRKNIQNSKNNAVDNVTCSFGLVSLQNDDSTESLLRRADKYLYKAKASGKNTVVSESLADTFPLINIPEFT